MKILTSLSGLLACVLLSGCGGDGASTHPSGPGPAATTAVSSASNIPIRTGDMITVRLSGVPDEGYFNEILVPSSGDITLPYLKQPVHAVGFSTADLANVITDAYKSQKIYTNPIVAVMPEERFIIVSGDVRGPSNVVWRSDSTLLSIINGCGGFTDYADRRHVRIIRGKQVFHVDCIQAFQTPGGDVPLLPDDQVYVPRTIF